MKLIYCEMFYMPSIVFMLVYYWPDFGQPIYIKRKICKLDTSVLRNDGGYYHVNYKSQNNMTTQTRMM